MIGFACNETPELMPLPIALAHALTRRLSTEARADGDAALPAARRQEPGDGRVRDGKPVRVDAVVISTQHDPRRRAGADLATTIMRARSSTPVDPGGAAGRADEVSTSTRRGRFVDRRADGRRRPDRPQDHRGHLRRHGPARRRRLLRQGPDQGGPLGGLRGALRGEEHRGGRPGRPLRDAGLATRSAWRSPLSLMRRDVRHRQDRRRDDRRS